MGWVTENDISDMNKISQKLPNLWSKSTQWNNSLNSSMQLRYGDVLFK